MLVLSSTFPRWKDDTEPRFVLDLCRHLSDYVDVRVLAPHTPGAALNEVLENVQVRRFRYFVPRWQAVTNNGGITSRLREKPVRIFQLPFLIIAFWLATLRLIREWNPDLIHAHWIVPQGLVACLAARNRIPVLCTSHGGDLHALRSRILEAVKRWVVGQCRMVTVVSQGMADQVRCLSPQVRMEVSPMGTDLSSLFVMPSDPEARKHNEIVFVGRLVEKKGLPNLIEAFAIVRRGQQDLNLTIVGDGPMLEAVRRHVSALGQERNVRIPGALRQRDLPSLYQRATLAAFPFVVAADGDQEGFGLVIAEAMGCGCPVIASDLPAVRQSIEPGVTGLLVPPGDPAALADALRLCLADAPLRSRLATNAAEFVRKTFDWPVVTQKYARAIENCVLR